MSESPFLTVSRLLSEETDAATELRILAKDSVKLTDADREIMRRAADALEITDRAMNALHRQVVTLSQELTAAKEQIVAHREARGMQSILPFTSMGVAVVAPMITRGW